ncbi:F0F1 ATP synthase subunit A [Candidatus Nomurabacteria bacterium]|nr:F0F1 ATP synthase subunit A [Candidatus Nomurabacteria bacterium]
MLKIIREIPGLDPNIVFHLFGYPIASSTLMIGIIIILFVLFAFYIRKKFDIRPSFIQTAFEMVYEGLLDLVSNITQDSRRTKMVFPVIGSMMIYLILANLIDLTPGLPDIEYNGAGIFSSPTADFNTTFGLALASVIIINFISMREWGFFSYLGNFFKFKDVYLGFRKSIGDGFIAIIEFLIGLLDIVGEATKVISLSLRLFGNMYAGKVLTIILFSGIAFIIPSVWFAMNLFVGVLQGIVFASLVAAYYTLAVKPPEPSGEREQVEA